MSEYLLSFGVGLIILALVEATVWLRVSLGLSMKHREASFTEIMRHAPYRLLWLPKALVAFAEIVTFCLAANYYRNGGANLTLVVLCFIFLAAFVLLAFIEGVRAVGAFEQQRPNVAE